MHNKIRQNLERKIEQKKRMKQKQKSIDFEEPLSQSFNSKTKNYVDQWIKKLDIQTEQIYPDTYANDFNDSDEEHEIDQVREKIHQLEKQLDQQKLEQLSIMKEKETVNYLQTELRKNIQNRLNQFKKVHNQQKQKLKGNYEGRIEKYLMEIEKLLEEKSEFNRKYQIFVQQQNKMNKVIKDIKQRFSKDLQNFKDAQLVLSKQRLEKYQHSQTPGLKEQAVLKLQPKLQKIIQQNKEQREKTKIEWEKKVEQQKSQYKKCKIQQLDSLKKKLLNESKKQKQQYRQQKRKRISENIQKLQNQFQHDRAIIRKQSKDRIIQLENKIRDLKDENLRINQEEQEQNLNLIKKMRQSQEKNIENLKSHIQDIIEEEIIKMKQKYKKEYDEKYCQLLNQNKIKLEKMKNKVQAQIQRKKQQTRHEVNEQKEKMQKQIYHKYEAEYLRQVSKRDEQKRLLQNQLSLLEGKLRAEQSNFESDQLKIKQFEKNVSQLEDKNEGLVLHIKEKQIKLQNVTQRTIEKQKQVQDSVKAIEKEKRQYLLLLDKKLGQRRKDYSQKEKQWLKKFEKNDDKYSQSLEALKAEKQKKIEQEAKIVEKIKERLKNAVNEEEYLKNQLEKQRKLSKI